MNDINLCEEERAILLVDFKCRVINVSTIVIRKINYSVFIPDEAHQPGLVVNNIVGFVKKIVFKVKPKK